MNVDVIIPVYKPARMLEKVLIAIQKQSISAGKIILMHTEDGNDFSWIQEKGYVIPIKEIMVKKSEFDHGATRHHGICESDADIVILMTQDAVPADRRVFENLIKTIKTDADVAVAYARQKAGSSDFIEKYTRKFNYPDKSIIKSDKDIEKLGIKTYFCSNVCAAYRREVYERLGGFEKNIIFNEDMVFAAKAIHHSYKIAYEAGAVVWHSHNYTGMQQLKRNFDLGVSQACYPEVFAHVKSETEGIRLVKQTALYLLKNKKPFPIIELIIQSLCKYLGFKLGRNYEKLPDRMIEILTMNPEYWKRRRKKSEQ